MSPGESRIGRIRSLKTYRSERDPAADTGCNRTDSTCIAVEGVG